VVVVVVVVVDLVVVVVVDLVVDLVVDIQAVDDLLHLLGQVLDNLERNDLVQMELADFRFALLEGVGIRRQQEAKQAIIPQQNLLHTIQRVNHSLLAYRLDCCC